MLNKIKTELVIFDLWQTLADVKQKPILEIFNFLKLDIDFSVFVDLIFKSDIFLNDKETEESLENFLNIFTKDHKKVEKSIKIWKDSAKNSFLYPDSINIIKKLLKKNIKICLLTNIDRYGFENFSHPELFKSFNYMFLSFKEKIGKPDLNCWFKIVSYFKINNFNKVLMIGDNFDHDIKPAHKLGIKTIFIKNKLSWGDIVENL